MASEHHLRWAHGEARIIAIGAMLAECVFALPSGPFSPFARAPWAGTIDDPMVPAHLRELAGDFVCLPFGRDGRAPAGPADWQAVMGGEPTHVLHGPAADSTWTLIDGADDFVTLALDYPDDMPVARLERTIRARTGAPALDFSLTVHARAATRTTLGLHPNFRLPERQGGLELTAEFDFGLVHPGNLPPGSAQEFARLTDMPFGDDRYDIGHVPIALRNFNAQLCGMRSPLTGRYLDEGAGFELDWDRKLLPSLQIWHTDRGIEGPPWNGQFRGIGLEPVIARLRSRQCGRHASQPHRGTRRRHRRYARSPSAR
jgi:hypothetical protein